MELSAQDARFYKETFKRQTFSHDRWGFQSWDWADLFDLSCNMSASFVTVKGEKIKYMDDRVYPTDVLYVVGATTVDDARVALVRLRDKRYAFVEEIPGDIPYVMWKVGSYKTLWNLMGTKAKLAMGSKRPDRMKELNSIPTTFWHLMAAVCGIVSLLAFTLGALIF